MLQVWLLGRFECKLNGRRVTLSARAAQSLLAYLVLSAGTPHRREKLAGLFWSDLPEENARRNLRHEIWRIRKALVSPTAPNVEYILADDLDLTFNREADFWLDAAQLQRPAGDIEALTSELALYRGELLPGMYDDWVSLERERFQSVFENKMQTLLEKLIAAERWNTVVEWGERWIAQGQTPEPAYRALMVAHAAHNNLSQVVVDYERCAEAMRGDLGVEPTTETRALYERLTRGERGATQIGSPLPTVLVQPAGTITFLFSDIEGSTKLLERLGNDYATLLSDQRDILRTVAEKFSGYEVDTQGDSFFFAFFRAADAVQFAAEAQTALANHKWPHDATLRVRMGLHTGEPMLSRTGYVGMDVHRAARIGSAGHGGQVLMSQTTGVLVENHLPDGTVLKDLGEHKLKDLRYPVHIIQLSVEGLPSDFPPLKATLSGSEPPAPGEPPFKGLEFFDEQDADLFFGREQLTAKLIRGLRATGFLAVVVGASGSGKSSVVRAGVVPALKKGAPLADGSLTPADSPAWMIYILTPTAHPLEALASALTRNTESVTATATLIDDLTRDPRALHLYLLRNIADNKSPGDDSQKPSAISHPPSAIRHVLLVIDQFEELFTLCRDEFEREAFIDNLVTSLAYGADARLTLMLTIRADFYAHLAQYPELRDAVAKNQEFIGPMTSEELRTAIEEPAKREGWEFEPGLVDLILRDVGDEPGALPLLSHALLETWKRRSGHTMTLKGYQDSGGVRGAIAQTAEDVYQQFTPSEQAIVRDIFLRLTELGDATEDTRRRASFDELIPRNQNAAAVHAILTRLADARLITLNQDSAEVAHEALIREWPQLREWLNQDRDGLRLHRQITEDSQEWELLERDPGALYRGARLIQARDYAEKNPFRLNDRERTFLLACEEAEVQAERAKEEQQQRELAAAQKLAKTETQRADEQRKGARRLRWFAAGLALFLLLALGAAWIALNQGNMAQANFVAAERIRIASQAQIALDNGEGGDVPALLALQSMKLGYSTEADASLINALKRGFTEQVFTGHTDLIWTVEYSPDGKRMVTSSNDGTLRLWDLESGKEIGKFEPGVRILDTAVFSPDGRYVLAGGPGTVARLWDTKSGEQAHQFEGHVGGVWYTQYSADGKLAVISDDHAARLWDMENHELLREFAGHTAPGVTTAISRDGKLVVTGGADKNLIVWDAATGIELARFALESPVLWPAISIDGKSVFTAAGNLAQEWDIAKGTEKRRFAGHTGAVTSVAPSLDGKYLVTGSSDKTARLWDLGSGQEIQQFIGHTGGIFGVAYSPDGRSILTASEDRTARLWQVGLSTEPISTGTLGEGNINNAASIPAALSPKGDTLMYGYDLGLTKLHITDLVLGTEKYLEVETTANSSTLAAYAFSSDNRFLLGADAVGVIWMWDTETGKLVHKINGHTGPVRTVKFSSDDRLLVSGGEDKSVRVWETATGNLVHGLAGHTAPVRSVSFSQDGNLVVSGGDDNTARIWDAHTGRELGQLLGHTAPLRTVAFSADGKFVVTGGDDQTARLWDAATGKELRQFIGHTAQVSQVAFSPDGLHILTGSADKSARLWNAQTGTLEREYGGHLSPLMYMGFGDEGRSVITGDTQYAYRWRTTLDDVIAFTCSQLTRDLTAQERELYGIKTDSPTCPR